MPLRKILLFLIMILCLSPVSAGDKLSKDSVIFQPVKLRIAEKSDIEHFLKDREYDYGEDYKLPSGQGFLQRLWNKVLDFLLLGLKTLQYLPIAIRILLLISLIVIVYIIATKTRLYKLFYKDQHIVPLRYQEIDPLNTDFDFDKAIMNELMKRNFRSAIRLLHLKVLKDMGSENIIRLSKDKTNREYSFEISNNSLRSSFITLTGIYNRVWYGKYPLSEKEYMVFAGDFRTFINTIHVGKE